MIALEDLKKIDLRVARIIEVDNHPNADRLLLLTIDTGDEKKQIVAGIKSHYSKEDLCGKSIIVVNNLEPAEIRGVTSNGMLLAARDADGLSVLTLDNSIAPGSKVS